MSVFDCQHELGKGVTKKNAVAAQCQKSTAHRREQSSACARPRPYTFDRCSVILWHDFWPAIVLRQYCESSFEKTRNVKCNTLAFTQIDIAHEPNWQTNPTRGKNTHTHTSLKLLRVAFLSYAHSIKHIKCMS